MSSLNTKYYILNKEHSLNINKIINTLNTESTNIINWCKKYDFINCQLEQDIDDYPKFLNYYHFIDHNVKLYNQNKILTTTSMSLDQLKQSISDPDCFNLQNQISKYADNFDDLNKEYALQKTYFVKYQQIYNKDLYIYNYKNDNYNKNYVSLFLDEYASILNRLQLNLLDRHSFFHSYFLKSLLNEYFYQNNNLVNNLFNNSVFFDLNINYNNLIDDTSLISDVVDIILINQYNFNNIDDSFKNNIVSNITLQNKIISFKDLFTTYLSSRYNELKGNYLQTVFDIFNHSFSFQFFDNIYSLKSCFDFIGLNKLAYNLYFISELSEFETQQFTLQSTEYALTLNEFENQLVFYYGEKLNSTINLKQYFYLLYLIRNKFEKFVNSIDLVMSSYAFNNILLKDVYYFNKFSHLKNLFQEWSKNIYFENFNKKISEVYNQNYQLSFLSKNNNILKFALLYELYPIIEDFIQTDDFEEYLRQIQKEVYHFLRSSGYINHDVDWCSCIVPLKIYFNSLLKKTSTEDNLFNINEFKQYFEDQIRNSKYNILNKTDFDIFTQKFINESADKMFSFFQNSITCINGGLLARAVHNVYKL